VHTARYPAQHHTSRFGATLYSPSLQVLTLYIHPNMYLTELITDRAVVSQLACLAAVHYCAKRTVAVSLDPLHLPTCTVLLVAVSHV
jgi:hypothetical protein